MLSLLKTRLSQGHRTTRFPLELPVLPDRFRGRPEIDPARCTDGCKTCVDACPSQAITIDGSLRLDLGRCLFCTACIDACPEGAIRYTHEHRMAASRRADLVLTTRDEARRAHGR